MGEIEGDEHALIGKKKVFQGIRDRGGQMQKILQTIVTFGDVFGAKVFARSRPDPFCNTTAMTVWIPIDSWTSLLTPESKKRTFTVVLAYDFVYIDTTIEQKEQFLRIYATGKITKEQLFDLGLINETAFSCACYLTQIGTYQKRSGDRLG